MKNIKIILTALMVVLSLCSCSAKENHDNTAETREPTASPVQTEGTSNDRNTDNNNNNTVGDDVGRGVEDAGNAVGDAVEDIGQGVGDVTKDAGDAVKDVTE